MLRAFASLRGQEETIVHAISVSRSSSSSLYNTVGNFPSCPKPGDLRIVAG